MLLFTLWADALSACSRSTKMATATTTTTQTQCLARIDQTGIDDDSSLLDYKEETTHQEL